MDPILQMLLSWQFVLFGLAISAILFVVRKFVEFGMEKWAVLAKESKLWNDLLLPIAPVVLGGGLAVIIKQFPYPDNLTSGSSRFVFGLVAGLLSTLLYRIVNSLLGQKISDAISSMRGNPPSSPDDKPETTK